MELNKELLKTYREDVLLEVQEEMERVFGSAPDIIDKIVDALLKMHHKEG